MSYTNKESLKEIKYQIDKLSKTTDIFIKKLFKDTNTDYIWLTEAVLRLDSCEKLRGRGK